MPMQRIVRCPSCDGYGWIEDWHDGEQECDWCKGIGYVYRDQSSADRPIPVSDLPHLTATLEGLEIERLRELGYTGSAKKPWEQAIRRQRED